MKDAILKLAIGGMLHDIGKVLYRGDDRRNHSQSGFDFLRDEGDISDSEILDQIRYHHARFLRSADIPKDSLAYITYMADNIAAAADRRLKDAPESGFDRHACLDSIFNRLNGNHGDMKYHPAVLNTDGKIQYPSDEEVQFDETFYIHLKNDFLEVLKQVSNGGKIDQEYVNSLLEVLEADLTYIPSSTSKSEVADISLFDHSKLTAALGCCIYEYLLERGVTDYHDVLFSRGDQFYSKEVFQIFSMDISGIQNFIYEQYDNEDVLKNLRARSFYLEMMMENLIDELLFQCGLSRVNLIYSGGGHAYLLLSNTKEVNRVIKEFSISTNAWMREVFQTDLYVACGSAACTADDLINRPEGSYQGIYRRISGEISAQKIHRYSPEELRWLNSGIAEEHTRECRICHRSDHLTQDDLCKICDGLIKLSKSILKDDFFVIVNKESSLSGIPIWKDQVLVSGNESFSKKVIRDDPNYVRVYSKNRRYTGESLASKLWVGDYCSADTLEKMVNAGTGIKRLGVLRADIDNLGQTFINGFPPAYQTLSRAATFSRKMSLFFKLHINNLLQNGQFSLDGGTVKRNAAVIYSGGDDVFIVGAWKDVLEFAVDLSEKVRSFTQGALTISAGFGLYRVNYPISYIASDTGKLEDRSKQEPGKDALTLFEERPILAAEDDKRTTFHWQDFCSRVIKEKFMVIYEFFSLSDERGKAFLYHILSLFKEREKKINLARLAYLFARLEPDPEAPQLQKDSYTSFKKQMYRWSKNDRDSAEVIIALYLYIYLVREREEEDGISE